MRTLRAVALTDICELVTDGTHDSPKLQEHGVPFIKGKHINAGKIDLENCDYITQQDHEKCIKRVKPIINDVLVANIGASIGDSARVVSDVEFSIKNVALLRPDPKKIAPSYFFQLVKSGAFQGRLLNQRLGAAQPYVSLEALRALKVPIVESYSAQFKIGEIADAYDDLIENNRRRIALLEESARMLYREWFVHFRFPGHEHVKIIDGLPEGWERRTLAEIAIVRKGKNITKETVENGDVPVVAGGLQPAYFHSKWNAEGPVITVSGSGANAGYVALYHSNIWASDCSYLSSSENANIWLLYFSLKSRQVEITGMQQGAAQPHVYPKQLERLVITFASASLRNFFQDSVDASFRLISNLERQNSTLTQARDLLLPRLMNGEIAI